jgi:hypothetical protein
MQMKEAAGTESSGTEFLSYVEQLSIYLMV